MKQNNQCSYKLDCDRGISAFPPQHQDRQPGFKYVMEPLPVSECEGEYHKLENKIALIIGGDSGIGRVVAYDFVKRGVQVAIVCYNEERDAMETAERIEQLGSKALLLCGDLNAPFFAGYCANKTIECFGKLGILVDNHAVQFIQRSILDISHEQLEFTFRNNVFLCSI